MCEVLFCSRSLARYLAAKYVGEPLALTMACVGFRESIKSLVLRSSSAFDTWHCLSRFLTPKPHHSFIVVEELGILDIYAPHRGDLPLHRRQENNYLYYQNTS